MLSNTQEVSDKQVMRTDMGFATIPVRQAVLLGIPHEACLDYARSLLYRKREEEYAAAYGRVADNQELLDEIFENEITATEDDVVNIVVAKAVGLRATA